MPDSQIITIRPNVQFQGGICPEKCQLDQIQTGRLTVIIMSPLYRGGDDIPASKLTLGQRWQWLAWSLWHMQRWANVGYK